MLWLVEFPLELYDKCILNKLTYFASTLLSDTCLKYFLQNWQKYPIGVAQLVPCTRNQFPARACALVAGSILSRGMKVAAGQCFSPLSIFLSTPLPSSLKFNKNILRNKTKNDWQKPQKGQPLLWFRVLSDKTFDFIF